MLDFGKIIIYTSNLRIIRAPPRKPEVVRHLTVPPVDLEGYPKAKERGSRRRAKALCIQDGEEKEEKQISDTENKVMILGQIILSGVVGFLSPCFCFFSLTMSFSVLITPSLSLSVHMSPAILSSLYLCFQERNCRITCAAILL